jgi:Tol biopolymer transport system component
MYKRVKLAPNRGTVRSLCALLCLFTGSSLLYVNAYAQYFGRNKVNYETFAFEKLHAGHFEVYYYPEEEAAARDAGLMLERWYGRFSSLFGIDLDKGQPVILYANQADFQQTNVVQGIISQGTGGFTEGMKKRVVLPLTGVAALDDHVLGHELVHAFQYTIVDRAGTQAQGADIPLWAVEGMAEYLSLGPEDSETAMWLRDAVLHDDVPSIKDVSRDPRYFPYRYGHAIWSYIGGRWGDKTVPTLFAAAADSGWSPALRAVLGADSDSLSRMWERDVKNIYRPALKDLQKPEDVGEAVVTGGQRFNVAPAISPDSRYFAYLSQRDIFTIDLYLAETATGRIIKKLVSSNTDSHFDALRFIQSAGTWSPDGKMLAFVTFDKGNNRIAVLDVSDLNLEKEIAPAGVDAIQSLAWSPDGRTIAFSGTHGGISNLYLYDLEGGGTAQLTDDQYAEIHPAWSPDGKTLAYASDRSDDEPDSLDHGPMRIRLMDVESRTVREIYVPGSRTNTNPSFSPDGESVYCIADPDGVDNIYEYSLSTGDVRKITDVATGIAGIGKLSPAMSVARRTGDILFSVFVDQGYSIHRLKPGDLAAAAFTVHGDWGEGAILPPGESAGQSQVAEYLSDTAAPAIDKQKFESSGYRGSLRFLAVGPTAIGVATDRSGAYLAGGTSLLFGDMLGNRQLEVTAIASGSVKDIGGEVYYQNLEHRTNWGVAVAHIPYRSLDVYSGTETVAIDGDTTEATVTGLVKQRTFLEALSASAEYPLSTNRRLELNAGFARYSFEQELDTTVDVGGLVIGGGNTNLPAPAPLTLGSAGVAYVGDYSFFGIGSPARGKRFRFELDPSFGSLNYMTALADYRHYFFFNPLTLAVRVMHMGRYLSDAEDDRLFPLFLGYENLVRGYSIGSFSSSECQDTSEGGSCPELDRLIGSRIGVFNLELRIPVLGAGGYGLLDFPYLPTEVAPFFDGGVAWTQGEKPVFKLARNSEERIPVFSTGVALRFLILGGLVTQVYYAYPFERSDRRGEIRFAILNGW